MSRYVAFLRGINVGGNKVIKMEDLRAVFDDVGCLNVSTVLASGNVIFEAAEDDPATMTALAEEGLSNAFGTEIGVILRTFEQIRSIVEADPLAEFMDRADARFLVSFLGQPPHSKLQLPYESPYGDFRIQTVTEGEVYSIGLPGGRTTDAMKLIEKEYGPKVTTRSWGTVLKIHKQIGEE